MLPVVIGVVLAVVVIQAVRRPVLRRLAVRDATRRPAETVLVIAGSLLGTALITGSLIVGNTLDSSIKATAFTQLGPVDEVVTLPDAEEAEHLRSRLEGLNDPRIDGVMTALGIQAAVAAGDLAEPEAQLIEMDFSSARRFGSQPETTGISGATPAPGDVAITEDLAGPLELSEGDQVTVYLYGHQLELTVDRILPSFGLAGFWLGFESVSPNAFVAPGTIASSIGDRVPRGAVPPVTSVLVSNRGGVEEGARLSGHVTGVIEGELGSEGLRVDEVKRTRLDNAEAIGKEFGELFLAIGSFAIVAGILLLVNIFVMLAEERKSELGMLRAVGMQRSHLVRAFVIEGAIYSFASAVLGALTGIGVGWAIVALAAPIFSSFGDFSLDLRFAFEPQSLITGFCVGALICLATITFTSLRIARINIIRAVRDLPEPPKARSGTRSIVMGSLGAALFTAWWALSLGDEAAWLGATLGLPLALFSLIPVLGRFLARRLTIMVVSAAALAWGILNNVDAGGEIFVFVVSGILLTFSAVVLLTQAQETLGGLLRGIAARNLPLRLSVAYPLARRFRTGLTLGMFALVIFTMTFISVLSNVFGGQVDTAVAKEGGFDILATASNSNPPDPRAIEDHEGVERVAILTTGFPLFLGGPALEPEPWPASGIDSVFVAGGPPSLAEKGPNATTSEVWERLVSDPTTAIVPSFFLQEGGGPAAELVDIGDEITAIDPITGEETKRTVIGLTENDFAFSGVFMSTGSLRDVLGVRASASRFYIEADEGADPNEVALSLQGSFIANGMEADGFRRLVEESQAITLQFFQLMQSYLALGLLVGIAGLGVVMVRAVRERRREIGVLRSLGFVPAQVRLAFLLESGFVALEGIVVGAVLALITASRLIATGEFGQDLGLVIPWVQLLLLTGSALVASLIATAWPAQDASRTAPAVALRSV
ncbi:MAG TPA: FtsX-like permease family protein [Actinomycetota bacterium]|nr:FtsX-like permease family protein [Actinomycetota bacterium]